MRELVCLPKFVSLGADLATHSDLQFSMQVCHPREKSRGADPGAQNLSGNAYAPK